MVDETRLFPKKYTGKINSEAMDVSFSEIKLPYNTNELDAL